MYGSPIWMVSGGILELCPRSNIEYHWIGLGRYLEHAPLDEWLYNGGLLQGYVLLLADRAGLLLRRPLSGGTYHSWIAHFFIVGDGPT